ncbi:MAG: efflux RND transporter periplasmic adaptor subunit [Anaerolineales bacterium]
MKKRTIIIIAAITLVLALSAYGIVSAQQKGQSKSVEFQIYRVSYGPLSAVVDETGEVYADQSAMLVWETSGIVGEVQVELGEVVTADQVLATLSEDSLSQPYYLAQQEIISAQRALEDLYEGAAEAAASAQLVVANARDALDDAEYHWLLNQPGNRASEETLKAAKAKVIIAEIQLKNKEKHFKKAKGRLAKAQAQIVLTDAINQYQHAIWYENWLRVGADEIEMAILDANVAVALANLEAAEKDFDILKNGPHPDDITIAEARITAAQASLDQAMISAPFDGVITAVEVLPGDLVSPNTIAFRIDNLQNLLVDVGVSEVDINQIGVGQPVTLEFDAVLGKEYQGEITKVSPVGIQEQGLVSFQVSIKLIDADEDVSPGMTAAVAVVVSQIEEALLVPNRSVRWVSGEQVVYLAADKENINESTLKKVTVTLGASSDEFTEVLEGEISEGDIVILNPPSVSIFDEMEPGQGPPGGFGH